MEIKKVIICGLGALGLTYANKLKDVCDLKILADETRIENYRKKIPTLNGQIIELDYITPSERYNTDLIIISTKYSGLNDAIKYIENFVGENTIIISLLNGISSEEEIAKIYGRDKVIHSYFIGHSAVREINERVEVTQDGVGKIVFNSVWNDKAKILEKFFKSTNIDYEIPEDIIYSMWLKFGMNIFSNQTSAILNMTFGDMKKSKKFKNFAIKLIAEVRSVGEACGVKNLENLEKDSLFALSQMIDSGKTSMHQDILAGRKTEVDIFAGEIIKLGKKYGIETPYNQVIYDMIKILEDRQ